MYLEGEVVASRPAHVPYLEGEMVATRPAHVPEWGSGGYKASPCT
jgi:hypothetical protein